VCVISGRLQFKIGDEVIEVGPRTAVRLAPSAVRSIWNGSDEDAELVRAVSTDGYTALQVTYGHKDAKKLNRPDAGQFSKTGVAPGKRLIELRLDNVDGFSVGQEITVDQIPAGSLVDVTATTPARVTPVPGRLRRALVGDSPGPVVGVPDLGGVF